MTFPAPIPLADALAELRRRKLITTRLSSAELRTLGGEILRQALFAARLTQLRPLQALQDVLTAMLEGTANLADAKLLLTTVYRAMGYDPEAGGFPQDPPGTVPEALRGTLRDLSSERRMTLMVTTHYRMAANAGFVARGMEEQRRHQWPAWELVRIAGRITPRGWVRRQGGLQPAPGEDWPSRWIAAGGELFDRGTRMMAAKDSPVWQALGDGAGGHQDTLGNPFPPFAFGSGMGIREVRREEALLLGVISPEDPIARQPVRLAQQLKADAAGLSPDLLRAFKRDLVKREDGSVRLRRVLDAELAAAAASYRNRAHRLLDLLNGKRYDPTQPRDKHGRWADAHGAMDFHTGRYRGPKTPAEKALARRIQARGDQAMDEVIRTQRDQLRAMHRPGLVGEVHFYWGDSHGGVKHIIDGHGEAVARLIPSVIAYGKIRHPDRQGKAINIEHRGMVAVLKRVSEDRAHPWLLTGFTMTDQYRHGKKRRVMNSGSFERNPKPTHHGPTVQSSRDGSTRIQRSTLRARCNAIVRLLPPSLAS